MRSLVPSTYQQLFSLPSAIFLQTLITILFFGLILPGLSNAQEQDTTRVQVERDLERAIEDIDPEESDLDLEELIEFLENLANNPMNINRASVDDLMQIPGLNFRLAQNIVRYRSDQAPFTSVEDLGNVSGIGPATLGRIRPYVSIGTGMDLGRDLYLNPRFWTNNSRFEAFSRYQQVLQEQEGYTRPDSLGGYVGSPVKYYQRFRYTSNHLSLNLTQDKDPGEPLNGPADFDFTSWHLEVRDIGHLQNLVIGDFSVAFGQGLLLWSGGAFGKGQDVIRGPSKNERGIRPFTSAQEAIGFRGVAATVGQRLQFTGFYSNRQRTASIADKNRVNFPTQTGFHRTLNEIDRRNNLSQTTVGGRIRAQLPFGFLGVSAFHNHFDTFVARGSQPYQRYNFSGQNLAGYAADYRFLLGDAILFGEFAYTDNGGYGFLSGMEYNLGRLTDLLFVYRQYDKALQSIFGAGFGEQSGRPRNEQGFYVGIRHALTDQIRISGYFDQFKFPAPRFQTTQPTSGYDWLATLEYQPFRELSMYVLARYKVRDQEYADTDVLGRTIRLLDDNSRANLRFQADYQVHPRVRLRTRFDMVRAQAAASDASWGYLVFQDIRFYPTPRLQVDARITMFDTDDFDSRVFQFENDLLYVLSNTMLFDQGQRMYVVIKYEASNWLDFWFKAATTVYENRTFISSGLAQIDGNRRSDIGLQARIRF